uniref:Dynamin stalk domain-containing protein n=1 Tax=Panagrolaimus davidi TaxID=227884 RepID=A0A914PJ86_9BILA
MERFPLLYDRIRKVVSTILKARIIKTKEFVEDYLEIELAYINTKHPEFIINENLLKAFNEEANDEDLEDLRDESDEDEEELLNSLTNRDKRDLHIISRLIDRYFQIVQKSIKDKVPNSAATWGGSSYMVQRRNDTSDMLAALNKANDVLAEIRDSDVW